MSVIDHEEKISGLKKMDNPTSQELRSLVKGGVKNLKTQWIQASQTLFSIHRDKLFEYWGYEKFDQYIKAELGIRKPQAMKMIKTYVFLENCEPHVLRPEFSVLLDTQKIPDMDVISVLRMIRYKDKITKEEYQFLRGMVFEKAVSASDLRSALKNIMDKKKKENPEEEREQERTKVFSKLKGALNVFRARALKMKWCDQSVVKKAEDLFNEINQES